MARNDCRDDEGISSMGMLESLALFGSASIAGLLMLDRVMPTILKALRPVLPNDVCGPDGWLVDLENGRGVFDRHT